MNIELNRFENFNAKDKICFTAKKYEDKQYSIEQHINQKCVISDIKVKKYLNIVENIIKI